MKTEKDTFDEWYKSEYPLDYEHYVNEQDIGLFTKLYLRCFASWKASAQREGYKLVPVEPPEDMDIKICRLVDHRIDVFEADRIYKAMIGAAP